MIGIDEVIHFWASIAKVQTMVDGGIRLTLDMPENAIMQMAELAECKRSGAVLDIEAKPLFYSKDQNAVSKRTKRKSEWAPPEESDTNDAS